MKDWREDYLSQLMRTPECEVCTFVGLAGIVQTLGFEYCSFGVRIPVPGAVAKELWWTTYPTDWQDRYLSNDYMTIDPSIGEALKRSLPVVWTDGLFESQPGFWEEARAHKVRHGWTLATHGKLGGTALLSLARSASAITSAELSEVEARLVWLSHCVTGMVGNVVSEKFLPKIAHELTNREREILLWTSAGKTSSEIGTILGITTRTVNFHVATALAKLDTVNKTQAVVKAVMLGLLN